MDFRRFTLPVVTVLALVGTASAAEAQVRFGAQANYSDDFDFGVGARVEMDLPIADQGILSRTFLMGSFDYFFPDCGSGDSAPDCSFWHINAGLGVPISASGVDPYAGAVFNYGNFDWDFDTPFGDFGAGGGEAGLGIFGGLRFLLGGMSTFGEAQLGLGGWEQFVLKFGVMFGGVRN